VVPPRHITVPAVTVICISLRIAFPHTYIPRDPCFPAHISPGMHVSPNQVLVIYVSLSWLSLSVAVSIWTTLLVTILLAVNNGKSLYYPVANNIDIASQLTCLNVTSQLTIVIRKLNSKLLYCCVSATATTFCCCLLILLLLLLNSAALLLLLNSAALLLRII